MNKNSIFRYKSKWRVKLVKFGSCQSHWKCERGCARWPTLKQSQGQLKLPSFYTPDNWVTHWRIAFHYITLPLIKLLLLDYSHGSLFNSNCNSRLTSLFRVRMCLVRYAVVVRRKYWLNENVWELLLIHGKCVRIVCDLLITIRSTMLRWENKV